jgi:hypothetical protein
VPIVEIMNNTTKTETEKFYTVTWLRRFGNAYERHEQTVRGENMLARVIAAVKGLPGVPAKSVRHQGALS